MKNKIKKEVPANKTKFAGAAPKIRMNLTELLTQIRTNLKFRMYEKWTQTKITGRQYCFQFQELIAAFVLCTLRKSNE